MDLGLCAMAAQSQSVGAEEKSAFSSLGCVVVDEQQIRCRLAYSVFANAHLKIFHSVLAARRPLKNLCSTRGEVFVAPPSRRLSWRRPRRHNPGRDALGTAGKM